MNNIKANRGMTDRMKEAVDDYNDAWRKIFKLMIEEGLYDGEDCYFQEMQYDGTHKKVKIEI